MRVMRASYRVHRVARRRSWGGSPDSFRPAADPAFRRPPMSLALLAAVLQLAVTDPPTYDARLGATRVRPPRADTTIEVDGRLDEPVWRSAARLTGFSLYQPVDRGPRPTPPRCWSGTRPTRSTSACGPSSRTARCARRWPSATAWRRTTTWRSSSTRSTSAGARSCSSSTRSACRRTGRRARAAASSPARTSPPARTTSARTSSGSRRAASPRRATRSRSASRSAACATPSPARRTGACRSCGTCSTTATRRRGRPRAAARRRSSRRRDACVGLTGMRHGQVVELNPELTNTDAGAPRRPGGRCALRPHARRRLGGNVRWAIGSDFVLNGTVKPDFSQVEADATQVAADQRFALFYPERRPFFVEGSDQFNVPNTLVYTRRIVQPEARGEAHRQDRPHRRRGARRSTTARRRGRLAAARRHRAPAPRTSASSRPAACCTAGVRAATRSNQRLRRRREDRCSGGSTSRSSRRSQSFTTQRRRRPARRPCGRRVVDRTGAQLGIPLQRARHRRALPDRQRLRAAHGLRAAERRATGSRSTGGRARCSSATTSSRRSTRCGATTTSSRGATGWRTASARTTRSSSAVAGP